VHRPAGCESDFNQSLLIAAVCGVFGLIAGYALTVPYLRFVVADEETLAEGRSYLYWLLPGITLQFAMVAMSSALRGIGIVKAVLVVQVATVLLNIVLAPVLIQGWGMGKTAECLVTGCLPDGGAYVHPRLQRGRQATCTR